MSKKASSRGSKKAQKASSDVFSLFTQKQVSEFKEAFQMMDADKDGVISKNDLRATFDATGRLASDKELEEMLGESAGPLNFTALLTLFGSRMTGAADDDDIVIKAFNTFDNKGKIASEGLRTALMTFGDKFSSDEVDDAFEQMQIDGSGQIDTAALIQMLTAKPKEEEETAAA